MIFTHSVPLMIVTHSHPYPTHSPVVAPSDTRKEWATAYGECGWVRSVGGFPRARHEKIGSFC